MRSLTALSTSLLVLLSAAASASPLSSPVDDAAPSVKINVINPVACSRPTRDGDRIKVHYRGRLLSTGEEFDSSYSRGPPFTFTLGAKQVIAGWDQGLQDMCPGEARELTIPPQLGYGNRAMGSIPAGSTLVFDTELVEIVGMESVEVVTLAPTTSTAVPLPTETGSEEVEDALTIATAPPTPPAEDDKASSPDTEPEHGPDSAPEAPNAPKKECQLLGPFALLVQGALGGFALLTLVAKRYRETPRRPWKIWFFDVSKQIFGSMLTHVLNVGMSMISSVNIANHAEKFGSLAHDEDGRGPNPCSYYLLNLGIDTTLGIPVLYILLLITHALFLRTPLANPPQSLKSGNYGHPPKWTWYLKQLFIYFIGLTGMKMCVFLLFSVLPWLPWVGDWALRWTKGNEKLEIAFAMFIFPLLMNAVQYYIIDNLIMDKNSEPGYEAVHEDDEETRVAGEEALLDGEDDDDSVKLTDDEPLKETSPTRASRYNRVGTAEDSDGSSNPRVAKDEDDEDHKSR